MTSEGSPKYRTNAYRGGDPYAFVSYSHENAEAVFTEMAWLSAEGLRLYYDEGIHPGHTWHDELAKAIENCAVFVLFVTASSVASRNCLRELAFALDNDKPVVAVHLEDVELPAGVRLAIGDRQAIIRSRLDAARYREQLVAAIRERIGTDVDAGPVPAVAVPAASPKSRAPLAFGAIALLILVAGYFGFTQWRGAQARAERDAIVDEIEQLVARDEYGVAFAKARDVVQRETDHPDPALQSLWKQISQPATPLVSTPGATVSFKAYDDAASDWIVAGVTPLETAVDLPRGVVRLRVEKAGFQTGEFAVANPGPSVKSPEPDPLLSVLGTHEVPLVLAETGAVPDDMVLVPETNVPVYLSGWTQGTAGGFVHRVPAFAIARFEVTNREFKEFVDAGGYDNPAYWDGLEFRDEGRSLTWQEARERFVDRTGRAGPAEWELGSFGDGKGELPVGGISWYEAVAYARFRHLSLPTIHHWLRAAFAPFEGRSLTAPNVANQSHFLADGPAEAHAELGLGPWGTWNTAGNVREWIWNTAGDQVVALGGSWRDYSSMYQMMQTARPMDRLPELGLRLMKSLAPVADDLLAPIKLPIDPKFMKREPVSDEAFEAMRFQFTVGDRKPKDVKVEQFAQSDTWVMEEVSLTFAAGEPFELYIATPRASRGMLQPILYGPPGDALAAKRPNRSVVGQMRVADIVVDGGRALVIPIWAGTYQRVLPPATDPTVMAERLRAAPVRWYQDAVTAINYLATRSDMDVDRLGFMGISAGAHLIGPSLMAVDGRVRAGVLIGAGILSQQIHPMSDAINYVPRIHCPVLMINGRYDSTFPNEVSQVRMFKLLGSPPADKKHVVYDVGHFRYPRNLMAKEVTDWFDKYLGPVK